jgi:hypothetical protein
MEPKLLTRDEFREGVFARDNHRCVFCGKTAEETPEGKLDAHHILERRLWPDGGYYLENGATVCEEDHMKCEKTICSVDEVRDAAKITKKIVPPQFYDDHIYDKWGNPILEDGRRGKGELFFDESVQKVLAWVIDKFTPYSKYGRTFHLPHSPGMHDDDKAWKDYSNFVGQRVIISKKMDGENTKAYSDGHVHARSIDSRGGEDRAWVKKFLIENVCFNLPEGWSVAGENLWAEHSIHYEGLPSYFLGFSLWDERNNCLSWDETLEYFELLGITSVPVLYDGIFDLEVLKKIEAELDTEVDEGYVVRLARAFPQREFRSSIAKYVRKGHVQTTKHWRAGRAFTPNGIKKVSSSSSE